MSFLKSCQNQIRPRHTADKRENERRKRENERTRERERLWEWQLQFFIDNLCRISKAWVFFNIQLMPYAKEKKKLKYETIIIIKYDITERGGDTHIHKNYKLIVKRSPECPGVECRVI